MRARWQVSKIADTRSWLIALQPTTGEFFISLLDMDMVEPGFDASTFSRNRDRLIEHDAAGQFFAEVVEKANSEKLLSHEHFSVDGTLIEAWASLKSFRPKGQDAGDSNIVATVAAIRPTNRRPIPKPSSCVKAKVERPSSASQGML